MNAKTVKASSVTPETFSQGFTRDVVLDFDGLNPLFNPNNGKLVLTVPAVQLDFGDIGHQLRKLGLRNYEAEAMLEEFHEQVTGLMVAKLVAARVVGREED